MYQACKRIFRNKHIRGWPGQAVLLLTVFYMIQSYQSSSLVSGVAPGIRDQLITGEQYNLKDYRGQVVLVHFWATWCPICKVENSSIDAIAKDYAVISVVHRAENNQQVLDFMKKENLTLSVIVDDLDEWSEQYNIKGVPSSFILDKDGNIKFSEVGYTSELGLRLRLWWAANW